MALLQHYIKSALKNFKRNKWYSILMVVSLAAGMFCFLLAAIYVNYEFSRNSNHRFANRVYQISLRLGESGRHVFTPVDFSEKLTEWNPNIEAVSILDRGDSEYLSANGEKFVYADLAFYGTPSFFQVFTFPLKYGNESEALSKPKDVVISAELSERLFPNINPVGRDLVVHEKGTFQVAGVLAPVSKLSLMKPELIFSNFQRYVERPKGDRTTAFFTHLKLKSPIDQKVLEADLYEQFKRLYNEERITGVYSERLSDEYWGYSHYNYGAQYDALIRNDKAMIRRVGYAAIAVLLCAFVGYLSISLSRSLKRAKEIGIRKVNGALRVDVKKQLLLESVINSVLALILTIVGLELTQNYFSSLFQVPIALKLVQPELLIFLFGFTLLSGLLAGAYPAFVVSGLNPVAVLSGFSSPRGSGFKLKRVLLIAQFAITVILVFTVFIQKLQVNKMKDFDDGMSKDGLVSFEVDNEPMGKNYQAILAEISQFQEVETVSGGPFPFNFDGFSKLKYVEGDTLVEASFPRVYVRPNFFETLSIPMVAGMSFEELEATPLNKTCIVNEAFLQEVAGIDVGSVVEYGGEVLTVVGIASNYSDWGVANPDADPRVFLPTQDPKFNSILLKVRKGEEVNVTSRLEDVWRKYESIMQPVVEDLGAKEDSSVTNLRKVSMIYGYLAFAVLVLSMMNLLGVVIIYGESQLKSIGIRRILGAESIELFKRTSAPFVGAMLLGLTIGLPIAYWLMQTYLNDFAVRMNLHLGHTLVIALIMVVVLFMVTSAHLIKVSRVNPVDILRE